MQQPRPIVPATMQAVPEAAAKPHIFRRLADNLWNECISLWHAFKASWLRVSLGALIGLTFIEVSYRFETATKHGAKLSEDVGVAFFVAALAVFGYEWKSHSKELVDAAKNLTTVLTTASRDGVRRCIDELFPGDRGDELGLRAGLTNVVLATHDVLSRQDWNREIAAGMVEALVTAAATNVKRLADTNPSGESGFPINLPRPVDIIEKMLTTQMNAVTSGEYVVISDFTSFQKEQLDTFTLAMKARITSGLVVRRLFFCFKHDKLIPLDEVKRIAREHRAIACEFPGKYEVRFTMPQKTVAEPPHEGVFTTSERSVRFTVLSPDLHQMEFFSHKQGHEPANFSELWRHAIPAKNDNESQAKFERYLGALTSEWPRGGGRR